MAHDKRITAVSVLGAGTMGAQIAAHFANAGIPALLLDITGLYRLGGAQAIYAFSYGIGTVPKVDMIVGPGNAYVEEAKRDVFGRVGIDMLAGCCSAMR